MLIYINWINLFISITLAWPKIIGCQYLNVSLFSSCRCFKSSSHSSVYLPFLISLLLSVYKVNFIIDLNSSVIRATCQYLYFLWLFRLLPLWFKFKLEELDVCHVLAVSSYLINLLTFLPIPYNEFSIFTWCS